MVCVSDRSGLMCCIYASWCLYGLLSCISCAVGLCCCCVWYKCRVALCVLSLCVTVVFELRVLCMFSPRWCCVLCWRACICCVLFSGLLLCVCVVLFMFVF